MYLLYSSVLKPGFHTCVCRTFSSARCLSIYCTNAHKQCQPSQQKPASSQKSRTCWTFTRGCEAWAAICCDCNQWKPRTQCTKQKIFSNLPKKSKAKKNFYSNDFRKVVIYNSAPDALRDFHTSECKRPHNRTYDGCLWKPAEHNKVHTSKQLQLAASTETLMETRLKDSHNKPKNYNI